MPRAKVIRKVECKVHRWNTITKRIKATKYIGGQWVELNERLAVEKTYCVTCGKQRQ